MVDEEVGFRLALKNRRETAAGIDDIGDRLDRAGDEATALGRKSRIAAGGVVALGKGGRLMGRAFVTGFGAASAAAVGAGIILTRFSTGAIAKASDLSETISKSGVIFGDQAKQMRRWARNADQTLGLSQQAALSTATSFGDMFSQIGFTDQRAAKLSRGVVQLATDFGSFNNLETEDVLERISAGFRGEYDSLQAIIPNISAARVEQTALELAHKKTTKELTAQDKALGVLNILHKDGARAMGDFARTSDGLANQQKIMNAQYDNASAKLGRSLMPLQLKFVGFLNREAIPALSDFADWFDAKGVPAISRWSGVLEDKALPVVRDVLDEARPLARSVLPAMGSALKTTADAFKVIAPKAKATFDAFNGLPDWAKAGIALTIGGGALGAKLGAGKLLFGRGKGSVLGGITKAAPLPVIVVNKGWDTGVPGGGGGGGKPGKTPPVPVPPGLPTSGWRARLLGLGRGVGTFGLGALALAGGVTYASKDGTKGPGKAMPWSEYPEKMKREVLASYDYMTRGARDAFNEVGAIALEKLPPKLTTDIIVNGVPQSRRDVLDLAKTYDLTKAQRRTLFETYGIPRAKQDTGDLMRTLNGVPRRVPTTLTADISPALSDISRLEARIAGLSGTAVIDLTARGFGAGREHGGPVTAGRPYVVGEKRPELFVPKVDGTILPRVPDAPDLRGFFDTVPAAADLSQPIVVQAILDGKIVAENTVEHLQTKAARR